MAFIFTGVQAYEYYNAGFSMADGAFGSCFYFATGTHGLHVLVGSIFILVCLIRLVFYHLTNHHHLGFEGAILYWHFVDAVWLVLYVFVYIWGSGEPPVIENSPPFRLPD
jgi:cytochrome c oxidase subunit 3